MQGWSTRGLPHKGWICVDVIDLAEGIDESEMIPYERCEMCGNEKIRYAHVMKHPNYPDKINVGCVCAEKMTGDYVNPRRYENDLRNRAQRRKNFKKVQWRFSPTKGTYSKKYKGEYITIMQSKYGGWGVFFEGQRVWKFAGKKIRSFEEADNVAFYIFEKYHTTQEKRTAEYCRNMHIDE